MLFGVVWTVGVALGKTEQVKTGCMAEERYVKASHHVRQNCYGR